VYKRQVLFDAFVGSLLHKSNVENPSGAIYILENYPDSKFAAWADVHLAWDGYLTAKENSFEARRGIRQDSTDAMKEAKIKIIDAERHLEAALESQNELVKPYAKKLYYMLIDLKQGLGMYENMEAYFDAYEYLDSINN